MRFLWLSCIALVVVALYMFVSRYLEWRNEAGLFETGIPVQAEVFAANSTRPGAVVSYGDAVDVRFKLPDGSEHTSSGYLDNVGQSYRTGESIAIRVDPAHLERWTARLREGGLGARLIGGYLALLAAIGTLFAAIIARNFHRSLWRDGVLKEAIVAGHEQQSLAPRSTRVRCHVTKGRDVVVVRVCVPQTVTVPAVGEKTWLLCDESNWRSAIPLTVYQ